MTITSGMFEVLLEDDRFWTTLQAHSDSVCSSWDKNGPIPEVTGFHGFMAWENSYEPAVGLLPVIPDATSQNLGWVGLQAFRYRDAAPNEVHWPPLSQHLLILTTRPPAKMRFRYEGGKRDLPSPAGSITVMPVGSEAELCWQGTADCLHIYLDPKLTARVATTSLELDVSHTAIPPLDALILPELRTTMLAVDAELTNGGLGGPLLIESLANILRFACYAISLDGAGSSLGRTEYLRAGSSPRLSTTSWRTYTAVRR